MEFPLKARKVSYQTLQKASGLTPENFRAFWNHIQEKLLEPENRTGYLGASKCSAQEYRIWLNGFIAGGVGELGWGNGDTEWVYGREEDEENIYKLVLYLVGYSANQLRRAERKSRSAEERANARHGVSTTAATPKVHGPASPTGLGPLEMPEEDSSLTSLATSIMTSPRPNTVASPSSSARGAGQGNSVPSELPSTAQVIFVNKSTTTFDEFLQLAATICRRPKSRISSAVTGIRVYFGGWGEFIEVTDESSWNEVKELLDEEADSPGLQLSIEFD